MTIGDLYRKQAERDREARLRQEERKYQDEKDSRAEAQRQKDSYWTRALSIAAILVTIALGAITYISDQKQKSETKTATEEMSRLSLKVQELSNALDSVKLLKQ